MELLRRPHVQAGLREFAGDPGGIAPPPQAGRRSGFEGEVADTRHEQVSYSYGGTLDAAVAHFNKVRQLNLKKKPATAEFLAWLTIVKTLGIDLRGDMTAQRERLEMSYPVLAKNKEDLAEMKRQLKAAGGG